jgi:hypothetical protein
LGVNLPAEFTKLCLITLELRSTFGVDWPFASPVGSTQAFCLSNSLVPQSISALFLRLQQMEERLVTRAKVLDVRKLLLCQLLGFCGSSLGVVGHIPLNLSLEELEL